MSPGLPPCASAADASPPGITAPLEPDLIFVVDDEVGPRRFIRRTLSRDGYGVRAFASGRAALAAARHAAPFLAIVDVRMPDMDGYALCRALHEDDTLAALPVLFLSGTRDPEDRVRGFEAGAADYIDKPVTAAELSARVRTHVQNRHCRERLEARVRERTRALEDAHRRLRIWDGCKDDWLNVLTHELRTPLTGVLSVTELLLLQTSDDPEVAALHEVYAVSRARIDKLIADAALLSAVQVGEEDFLATPVELGPVLRRALEAAEERVGVRPAAPPDAGQGCWTRCHEALLERALADLLFTAARCVIPPERVECRVAADAHAIQCVIETNGRGLDPRDLETFFDVGGQRALLSPGGDWGLSPPVAQHILALFHGHATVANRTPSGLRITVRLPRHAPGEPS